MDSKPCLNCHEVFDRPAYMSRANFKRKKYCSSLCGYVYRTRRNVKEEKQPIYQVIIPYEIISNFQYEKEMSEIQGLSRLYLDNNVNLDTLRIMELGLKG